MYENETKFNKNWSADDVRDITEAVKEMVAEIVYRTFEHQELLFIPREEIHRHLFQIGSMTSHSKVGNPDEFDFQVYFPHFSDTNVRIKWVGDNTTCVNLLYVNTTRDRHVLDNGLARVIVNDSITTNIVSMFHALAKTAIEKLYDTNFQIEKKMGTLRIDKREARFRVVCVSFYLTWLRNRNHSLKYLAVRIDTVPGVYLSSPELFKRIKSSVDRLSKLLQTESSRFIPASRTELFTISPLDGIFTFRQDFAGMQTRMMRYLTETKPRWDQCLKIGTYLNPPKSQISSSLIRYVFLHDILPHMQQRSADDTASCVLRLIKTLYETINVRRCGDVVFPDLFGYDKPLGLFKCYRDKQLKMLVKNYRELYSRLTEFQHVVQDIKD